MSMIIFVPGKVDIRTKTIAVESQGNWTLENDKRHIYQEDKYPKYLHTL